MTIWQLENVVVDGVLCTGYNKAVMVIAEKTNCSMKTLTHNTKKYIPRYLNKSK